MQGNTQILLEAGLEQNVLRLGGGGSHLSFSANLKPFHFFLSVQPLEIIWIQEASLGEVIRKQKKQVFFPRIPVAKFQIRPSHWRTCIEDGRHTGDRK